MLTLGVLSASLINIVVQLEPIARAIHALVPGVALWRLMLGLPGVPAVPFFLGSLLLPEPPSTLAATGRLDVFRMFWSVAKSTRRHHLFITL